MSVERYNQIANSGNLPALNRGDLVDLRALYEKKFEVPLTTTPKFPEIADTERVNIKGRVEDIQAIEERVKNGNRNKKIVALLKAAAIVGLLIAGTVLASSPLSTALFAAGVLAWLISPLYPFGISYEDRKMIGKNHVSDEFLHHLTGPLYDVYSAFKFTSHYNKEHLDQIKSELVKDVEIAKEALKTPLDSKELDALKDLLNNRIPGTDRLIKRAKTTLDEIQKLHQL